MEFTSILINSMVYNPSYSNKYSASIIVVCYNQLPTIKLCLQSLSRQSTTTLFEVIICDDGSDRTCLTELVSIAAQSSLPVRVIWQQDTGYRSTQAKNNGIRLANGRILIFLDGDMVPETDFVEKHLNAHTSGKFVVAGNRLWRTDQGIDWGWRFEEILLRIRTQVISDPKMIYRQEKERIGREATLQGPNEDHWKACIGCNLSIPRSNDSYYDDSFLGWGPDDWELSLRLQKYHGHNIRYDGSICAYQIEQSGKFSNVFRTGNPIGVNDYVRNVIHFSRKYPELKILEHFRFAFARLKFDSGSWLIDEVTDFSSLDEKFRIALEWVENCSSGQSSSSPQ